MKKYLLLQLNSLCFVIRGFYFKFKFFLFVLSFQAFNAQVDPIKFPTFTSVEDTKKSKEKIFSLSFREKGLFNVPSENY